MTTRRRREVAGPALLLAGAGIVAGAAAGAVARRRRRAGLPPAEGSKEAARRLLEEPWRGNLGVVDELVAEEYVGHDPAEPEPILGPGGVRASTEKYIAAFVGSVVVDDQVAAGDRVVSRWTRRGTHAGELEGIPATGKDVTVSGITISRFVDGRIVEEWTEWDTLGLLVQLGAVSEPAHALDDTETL